MFLLSHPTGGWTFRVSTFMANHSSNSSFVSSSSTISWRRNSTAPSTSGEHSSHLLSDRRVLRNASDVTILSSRDISAPSCWRRWRIREQSSSWRQLFGIFPFSFSNLYLTKFRSNLLESYENKPILIDCNAQEVSSEFVYPFKWLYYFQFIWE